MKATVPQGYRPNMGDREKARLDSQLRAAANQQISRTAETTTVATGVDTTIFLSDAPMDLDTQATLQAKVHGSDPTAANYGTFEYVAFFARTTGAAAQLGATQAKHTPIRSAAGITVTLGVDGDSKLYVKVNDGGLGTLVWKAWVELRIS